MADWAGLHLDILDSILQKVRFIEDFVAFGAVCKSWSEAACNSKHSLRPQIPWLMLQDRENHLQVYGLLKEDILTKNLYIPEISYKKCFGLNYGWVLTLSRGGGMNLVHPLSRSQIELPHEKSIEIWEEIGTRSYSHMWTSCAALSANPSQTSDFAVMIVHGGAGLYLNYGRLGEKQWTRIPNQGVLNLYCDLTYYQDRFYGAEHNGRVWGFSVSDPQNRLLVTDLSLFNDVYIVGSKGDLLVVARELFPSEFLCGIEVYKLDLINGGYKKIRSLGNRAIFVGHNTTTAVDVSEFGGGLIKSNHIYFTDEMGSYNLEDGQFTPFEVPWSLCESQIRVPFWFIPSL